MQAHRPGHAKAVGQIWNDTRAQITCVRSDILSSPTAHIRIPTLKQLFKPLPQLHNPPIILSPSIIPIILHKRIALPQKLRQIPHASIRRFWLVGIAQVREVGRDDRWHAAQDGGCYLDL